MARTTRNTNTNTPATRGRRGRPPLNRNHLPPAPMTTRSMARGRATGAPRCPACNGNRGGRRGTTSRRTTTATTSRRPPTTTSSTAASGSTSLPPPAPPAPPTPPAPSAPPPPVPASSGSTPVMAPFQTGMHGFYGPPPPVYWPPVPFLFPGMLPPVFFVPQPSPLAMQAFSSSPPPPAPQASPQTAPPAPQATNTNLATVTPQSHEYLVWNTEVSTTRSTKGSDVIAAATLLGLDLCESDFRVSPGVPTAALFRADGFVLKFAATASGASKIARYFDNPAMAKETFARNRVRNGPNIKSYSILSRDETPLRVAILMAYVMVQSDKNQMGYTYGCDGLYAYVYQNDVETEAVTVEEIFVMNEAGLMWKIYSRLTDKGRKNMRDYLTEKQISHNTIRPPPAP